MLPEITSYTILSDNVKHYHKQKIPGLVWKHCEIFEQTILRFMIEQTALKNTFVFGGVTGFQKLHKHCYKYHIQRVTVQVSIYSIFVQRFKRKM
jgi:hypothetical protein